MAQHSADTPCPTAHTGSAQKGQKNCIYVCSSKMHKDLKTSPKLTLLRDEVCKNAVQRAAVWQVIQSSGAVWDEQRLVSCTLKGSSWHNWVDRSKSSRHEEEEKRIFSPSMDSSLAGVAYGFTLKSCTHLAVLSSTPTKSIGFPCNLRNVEQSKCECDSKALKLFLAYYSISTNVDLLTYLCWEIL